MLKIFKYAFYTVLAVVLTGYVSFKFFEYRFYSNAIPEQIDLGSIVKNKSQGFIRESCGGVIFTISNDTVERISAEGIAFLNQDLTGRGYKDDRNKLHYTYSAWSKEPLRRGSDGPDINTGFFCLFGNDDELGKEILATYKQYGAFRTRSAEAELLLIPSLKLLVYVYNG